MTENPTSASKALQLQFLRGDSNCLVREHGVDFSSAADYVRSCLTEVLNAPHIAFLLGAGSSSEVATAPRPAELGIPSMATLAADFFSLPPFHTQALTPSERDALSRWQIELSDGAYQSNLERLMEVLNALRFVLFRTKDPDVVTLDGIIEKVEAYIVRRCLEGEFSRDDTTVATTYERFFRKLVYRDRSLPRPWIFTTNYDLFSERALDKLGITYCNGFSGVIDRTFNPITFRYAMAEQLDVSSRKWSVVDNYLYLCKLHGSVSWIADAQSGVYGIREVQSPGWETLIGRTAMIFPTPQKQHAALSSPYTELFREFQSQIVREQSVLVTIGYGFGDWHIDAIIHQALTIPTFRIVVFGDPARPGIKRLRDLNDSRIWIIYGKDEGGRQAHYFRSVVDNFLPDLPSERVDTAIANAVKMIADGLRRSEGR